jgi:hypothetical protein
VIEFWLALAENFKVLVFVSAMALLIGAPLLRLFVMMESCGDDFEWTPGANRAFMVGAVCAVLACVPSVDDLWKTRIALIKFHLAAPENVQAATETIERLGKNLECKYLGGCEDAKPESTP